MAEDLDLVESGGVYSLAPPVEDLLTRMRNRWIVQFLSLLRQPRGSLLLSELQSGRIKTNADVVNLYALASAIIINDMRQLAEDIYPARAELIEFTFLAVTTLQLRDRVVTNLGSIETEIVVEAT